MKKLQQKGFIALEIILIVVVIGLIGGLGWWVYSQNKDKSATDSNGPTATQTTSQDEKITSTPLEIKEWGVKVTVEASDPIYKIQDNLAYLSTSSVENSAECKEVRKTTPEYMYGIARHSKLTDKLYVQAPEDAAQDRTVQDALNSSDNVKKVGDYYYEYFHGNGIDCAPTTVNYKDVFNSLVAL